MLQYFSARAAEIAQLVEQRIENSRVTSSSLVLGKHENSVGGDTCTLQQKVGHLNVDPCSVGEGSYASLNSNTLVCRHSNFLVCRHSTIAQQLRETAIPLVWVVRMGFDRPVVVSLYRDREDALPSPTYLLIDGTGS